MYVFLVEKKDSLNNFPFHPDGRVFFFRRPLKQFTHCEHWCSALALLNTWITFLQKYLHIKSNGTINIKHTFSKLPVFKIYQSKNDLDLVTSKWLGTDDLSSLPLYKLGPIVCCLLPSGDEAWHLCERVCVAHIIFPLLELESHL